MHFKAMLGNAVLVATICTLSLAILGEAGRVGGAAGSEGTAEGAGEASRVEDAPEPEGAAEVHSESRRQRQQRHNVEEAAAASPLSSQEPPPHAEPPPLPSESTAESPQPTPPRVDEGAAVAAVVATPSPILTTSPPPRGTTAAVVAVPTREASGSSGQQLPELERQQESKLNAEAKSFVPESKHARGYRARKLNKKSYSFKHTKPQKLNAEAKPFVSEWKLRFGKGKAEVEPPAVPEGEDDPKEDDSEKPTPWTGGGAGFDSGHQVHISPEAHHEIINRHGKPKKDESQSSAASSEGKPKSTDADANGDSNKGDSNKGDSTHGDTKDNYALQDAKKITSKPATDSILASPSADKSTVKDSPAALTKPSAAPLIAAFLACAAGFIAVLFGIFHFVERRQLNSNSGRQMSG